jgi:peroxiredoxin
MMIAEAIEIASGERPMKQFLLAAGLAVLSMAQNAPPPLALKVGDQAPDFTLPDTNNKPVKLSDFRGKKNVVLAFFPAAFTGG